MLPRGLRSRTVVASLLALTLAACSGDSPARPTRVGPTQSRDVFLARLEIVGPRSVAPGESVQFTAVGHLSDGTTTAYSASQTSWLSQHSGVLAIDADGRASGGQAGETTLSVKVSTLSASTEIVVLPAGTFKLSVVVNEGSVPALDVKVEVLSGVGAGLVDLTPVNGRYDLYGVAGDAQIRISGSGYRELIQHVFISEPTVVTVQVVLSIERLDVSGNYVLTIEGDAPCQEALPDGLANRRYDAVITQVGPDVRVVLQGADFRFEGATRNSFSGRMDNEHIVFNLGGFSDTFYAYSYEPRPDVMEHLGDAVYLYYVGGAVTSVSRRTLSGTFQGQIRQIEFRSPPTVKRLSECASNATSFVFSR
jgi:hypothetical protein